MLHYCRTVSLNWVVGGFMKTYWRNCGALLCAVGAVGVSGTAWTDETTNNCPAFDQECLFQKTAVGALTRLPMTADETARNEKLAGIEALDYRNVTQADVSCRESGDIVMENRLCRGPSGFFEQVKAMTRQELAVENFNTYRGFMTNFVTGALGTSPLPVCNIQKNETDYTNVPGLATQSCGRYCEIKVSTKFSFPKLVNVSVKVTDDNGSCSKEYGWYRGAFLQLENYYKEKVFSEFEKKSVALVDFGNGSRPCAALAVDAVRYQRAAEKRLADLVQRAGGEKEAAKVRCEPGKNGQDPTSQGACILSSLNISVRSVWAKLLGCELRYRAFQELERVVGVPADMTKRASEKFGDECKQEANCGIFCGDEERSARANACYQRNIPVFWKNHLKTYETTSPMEFPAMQKTSSSSGSTSDFAGTLLVGALVSRGSRRKKRERQGFRPFFAAAIIAIVGCLSVIGCDEGRIPAGSAPCIPCGTSNPSPGAKLCVYEQCMRTFSCFDVLLSRSVVQTGTSSACQGQEQSMTESKVKVCFRANNENGLGKINQLLNWSSGAIQGPLADAVSEEKVCTKTSSAKRVPKLCGGQSSVVEEMTTTTSCPDLDAYKQKISVVAGTDISIVTEKDTHDKNPVEVVCGAVRDGKSPSEANMNPYQVSRFSAAAFGNSSSCPTDGILGPGAQSGGQTSAAATTVANMAGLGKDFAELLEKEKPRVDTGVGSAASAGGTFDPGANSGAPVSSPRVLDLGPGGMPTTPPNYAGASGSGGGSGSPELASSLKNSSGSSGGSTGDVSAAATAAIAGANVGFESVGQGSSRSGKNSSRDGFFGAAGGTGPQTGVSLTRLSGAMAALGPVDANGLNKVGISLFEVINRRMDRWGRDIQDR